MSFVYPRTIAITRPGAQTGVGAQGYGGQSPQSETAVASGVPASIQQTKKGGSGGDIAGLPAGVPRSMWDIFFVLPNGTVQDRDIITDDTGIRYQVYGAYWNSLGYKCMTLRLEV